MGGLSNTDLFLRLLMALLCGAVIGLNRDLRRKPAGFRTFGLVSVGSAIAVLTILQLPGGADAVSRVIQGVLTGIGFLGAGVILHRASRPKVAGLTTAAAVWLTAGLGMASGAGLFALAGMGLVLAMLLLLIGGPVERIMENFFHGPGKQTAKPDRSFLPKDPDDQ